MEWTDRDYKLFSDTVDELRGLWVFIAKKFHENYDDRFWVDMVKASGHFKRLSQSCEDIPKELFDMVSNHQLPRQEREPHILALLHAAREWNVSDYDLSELKTLYARGKRIAFQFNE